jgi:DNA-binding Lrp family transcriptional regulator
MRFYQPPNWNQPMTDKGIEQLRRELNEFRDSQRDLYDRLDNLVMGLVNRVAELEQQVRILQRK